MRDKNRGLGRGLDSLIINTDIDLNDFDNLKNKENLPGLQMVEIGEIIPNKNQPRKTFDKDKIAELADSIKMNGIIQPIVLRKTDKGSEIVAGERRWRAAKIAGLKEVPCIYKEIDDEQNMIFAIIENMQREDLNPIEEAEGVQKLIDKFSLTQEEVAKSIGKSRPYVSNLLRILTLDDKTKEYVTNGKITVGHARVLVGMNEQKQKDYLTLICEKDLSVRELEKYVREKRAVNSGNKKKLKKNSQVLAIEAELKKTLGTKVSIDMGAKKNIVAIECYGREELERIIEILQNL
ncbi:MAG: ParB/RepB/Spo0J family partition protein [Eubacteriales bacterium]|nr:ParB/RepB/Spo0J family partition protein [Eubacteriales bacterium]MDY3332438.1 ParB/RepB/Spo0J family partition protein [Gallibacter sp.]